MENKKSFVQVRGTEFVLDDKPVLFKGMGVGSWLNIEHFMVGLPCTEYQMRDSFAAVFGQETAERFFAAFAECFMADEDFAFLQSLGVNLLRVPLNYRLFLDDQKPEAYREEGFRQLARLLAHGQKYGIYILPDLHTAPGGQNPDWHSDNRTGYTQFWHFALFREQMAKLWGEIARRFGGEPYLLGYDLLNEPYVISDRPSKPQTKLIQQFYEQAAAEIRKHDKKHILFWEGDHFAMEFDCLGEIRDEQTALMFHYYPTVWEPRLYDPAYDSQERKKVFERVFSSLASVRERFGRPVLCGEAGYETNWEAQDFTAQLLAITTALCQKYQVSFTLWSYKDARFMGLVYPRQESSWMKLVREIGEKWDHDEDTARAARAVEALCDAYFPEASAEEKYVLSFRQRALLYSLEQKHVLEKALRRYSLQEILRLPESFRFAQCERFGAYEALLRAFRFN